MRPQATEVSPFNMILFGWLGLSLGFIGVIALACVVATLHDRWRRWNDLLDDRRATVDRLDHIATCQEFERRGGHAVDWDSEFSELLKGSQK